MDEEKFIQRVENMLFRICGCTKKEATVILEKTLQNIKTRCEKCKIRMIKIGDNSKGPVLVCPMCSKRTVGEVKDENR